MRGANEPSAGSPGPAFGNDAWGVTGHRHTGRWHNRRVPGPPYDPAIVAALTDTVDSELRSQLADFKLDLSEIADIAGMVADQVLTEWDVRPRPGSPAAPRP